ncbi:MAG: hypothetical protein U0031_09945 [Thermomicrobiales bacterium]
MTAIEGSQQTRASEGDDLRSMVGPDRHRPGATWGRLRAEQIPVWAIVGHLAALTGTSDLSSIAEDAIARAAADYDISPEAVRAALLYYGEHRGAIDALLEANAAALA